MSVSILRLHCSNFASNSNVPLSQGRALSFTTFVACRRRAPAVPNFQLTVRASSDTDGVQISGPNHLETFLTYATSLYPVYMIAGAVLAWHKPLAFSWFVSRAPVSYSTSLSAIMLAMGLTLSLQDLLQVIVKQPSVVFFGFAAQYCIMPVVGALVSGLFGLDPLVSAGLILMACCPGGTASNVVTYIANGDVPLSVVMTACSTFGAVFATPLLTLLFAGTYVPVDVRQLAWSTLQVVLAPVLLGAWLQSAFPKAVEYLRIFSPLVAVLLSSLLASSVFSANASLLHPHLAATPSLGVQHVSLPSVALAVSLVHAAGFLLGYVAAKLRGLNEPQSRAVSIEVGMQNSSLAVVLAGAHFHSPLALLAPAVSAVVLNIMGSFIALRWRNLDNKV